MGWLAVKGINTASFWRVKSNTYVLQSIVGIKLRNVEACTNVSIQLTLDVWLKTLEIYFSLILA